LIPGTSHRRLVEELADETVASVLLVGHEPHLQMLAAFLVDNRRYYAFRKASMACVEVSRPVTAGAGTLEWLMSAEQMKQAL
jgi:phosphohistidine phosphatase SixA